MTTDRPMTALCLEHALLPSGMARQVAVSVDAAGRIAALGPAAGGETLVRGCALPGMPNLHSHAFQRAMAGSAEVSGDGEHNFWGWREVMYRFVERLGPADVEAIAALAYLEMLESGYTEVAEFHYLHSPATDGSGDPLAMAAAVRSAAERIGIRQLLLPTLYQRGGFGGEPLRGGQRRFGLDTARFLELRQQLARGAGPLQSAGIALHSLRAVDLPVLEDVVDEVRRADAASPIHIHIAEQGREVEDCLRVTGRRPVQWLLDSGRVDRRWCLVHATHSDADELRAIAEAGAVAGLCPSTEGNLGDGYFALGEFLALGGRFGIGSDSQVSLDPREELRALEYQQRLQREQRAVLAAPTDRHCGSHLYTTAQAGGAQACGRDLAGLRVGAPADFVVLDLDHPGFAGLCPEAWADAWIFAPRAGAVREVWVGGQARVRAGRHPLREPVIAAYRESLARLTAGGG